MGSADVTVLPGLRDDGHVGKSPAPAELAARFRFRDMAARIDPGHRSPGSIGCPLLAIMECGNRFTGNALILCQLALNLDNRFWVGICERIRRRKIVERAPYRV